jgi:hypothetical protein
VKPLNRTLGFGASGCLDSANTDRRRALGDIAGQLRECLVIGRRVDLPPDPMSSEVARADGQLVAQWALERLEGGKHGTAFARGVHVLQHELWHRFSIRQPAMRDIGATPWLRKALR